MPRNVNLSLTGIHKITLHVLVKNNITDYSEIEPIEVTKLKSSIMKLIIIPFMSKNWSVLEQNLVFFDSIKSTITNLIARYNNLDLQIYLDLIKSFETAIFLHMEIANLEEKLYGSCDNLSTLVFRTTMIRLKPELELYNLVFGRPNFKAGEKYNINVVNDIEKLLKMNNTTFEQIKKFLLDKYKI